MKSDSNELRSMRCMAWERAKGELESMLHTFWAHDPGPSSQFDKLKKEIEKFIEEIEGNGLHE